MKIQKTAFPTATEVKSSKRKIGTKIKKSFKAPKLKDDVDTATHNILDNQLDKLVIEKPPS